MNKREYTSPNKSEKIKTLKYANQRAVLSCLQHFNVLSVSNLAEMVHLSKTTIAQMLYSLADKQLVVSEGKGSSTREGGKKPELFRFNADFKYSIAISMQIDYIHLAVLNLNSQIRYRQFDPKKTFTTYESSIQRIAEQIEEVIRVNGIESSKIFSISISTEGIVDALRGVVRYPMHHSWPRNMDFVKDVSANLSFKPNHFHIDSPPAFMGYSELLSAENAQLDKIVFLYTDISAGGCIIKEREILHGANGFIGEFGHIILDPRSDTKCICGGTGCFESLVSSRTVLENAKRASGRDLLTLNELFADYKNGEHYAIEEINQVIHWFSILIHNLILVHDPDKIIIQGAYTGAGSAFLETLKEEINHFSFYKIKRDIDISFAQNVLKDSVLIGAAHQACNQFLQELHFFE